MVATTVTATMATVFTYADDYESPVENILQEIDWIVQGSCSKLKNTQGHVPPWFPIRLREELITRLIGKLSIEVD